MKFKSGDVLIHKASKEIAVVLTEEPREHVNPNRESEPAFWLSKNFGDTAHWRTQDIEIAFDHYLDPEQPGRA